MGRQLHRVPLLAEQRAFLEHLLDTVRRELGMTPDGGWAPIAAHLNRQVPRGF